MTTGSGTPTVGRIVLYTLTEENCATIRDKREGSASAAGNNPQAGDVVPFIVVRVWKDEGGPGVDGVNGQAILDGNDSLWVTSAYEQKGREAVRVPGTWHWPTRVPM
jgi:hypothetical protein